MSFYDDVPESAAEQAVMRLEDESRTGDPEVDAEMLYYQLRPSTRTPWLKSAGEESLPAVQAYRAARNSY